MSIVILPCIMPNSQSVYADYQEFFFWVCSCSTLNFVDIVIGIFQNQDPAWVISRDLAPYAFEEESGE